MKISNKIGIIVLIVIAGIFISIIIFLATITTLLSQKTVEKDFVKNYDNIMIVTDYLVNSEYNNVYIHKSDKIDNIYVNNWGNIIIDNPQFIHAIKTLFKKGYIVISKNENNIKFCRSSTIHEGSGVVYSIDGSKPIFAYLIKLEQLPETNWYYYEEKGNR